MKETAIAAALVSLMALLSWRCAAGEPSGPAPDLPLPAGARLVRRMEPIINLQPVRLVIATTTLSPDDVASHFRRVLPRLGWEEQQNAAAHLPGPLSFVRPGYRCWILAIRDEEKPESILMTEVRRADPPRQPALLARQLVASRLGGVPLYPGVKAALIVENGYPSGSVTVLYDTEASLERVAAYYARVCPDLRPTLSTANASTKWLASTGRFREVAVAIHLYRPAEGGTAVLILRGNLKARREEGKTCSGAATS